MAQHDYVISNGTGAAVRSDLNNALLAIVSQNSGATEPTTTYAYQWWADTTTGLLKIRNSANNAWITLRELDGTLTVEDGTVSAPGLAFRDDLNTGIWRPGTDQFAISTNGVERVEWGTSEVVFNDGGTNYDFRVEGDTNANLLFVDASADAVGIGTSAPSNRLHVEDTSGSAQLRITGTGGYTQLYSDGNFYIQPNGSTKMVVQSGGNVGIGTTTVNRPLVVFNDSVAALSLNNTTTGIAGGDGFQIQLVGSDGYVFNYEAAPVIFGTAATERARIDSSGRLLLGTSTSRSWSGVSSQFQIENTGSGSFATQSIIANTADVYGGFLLLGKSRGTSLGSHTIVQNNDIIGKIHFSGADGSVLAQAAAIAAEVDGTPGAGDMPGRLVFSTTRDGQASPTEAMRITNAGNVLIGGTSTNAKLEVTASAAPGGSNFIGRFVNTYSGDVSNAGLYVAKYDNNSTTSQVLIKFSINNDTAGQGQINANGASQAAFGTFSDSRLKENIIDLPSQWNSIKSLRPVEFDYIQSEGGGHQIGFIAQDVQDIYPDVVGEREDGMLTLSGMGKNESRLIKALQEAMERIETLEAKVVALESA